MRVQMIVFVVLAALFLASVAGLAQWGRALAHKAYRPLLVETTTADLTALRFDQAEEDLVRAVRTSPAYERVILDTAVPYLNVMPRLARRLLERAALPDASPETRLDALRIRCQLGQYECALDVAVDKDAPSWIAWQVRWLRAHCLQALGRWDTPEASPPPLPPGWEKASMAPEIRAVLDAATSQAVRADDDPYRQGVVAFSRGDLEAARDRFEAAVAQHAFPADAAYRLGRLTELNGDRATALYWYGRALALDGPPHAAAAKAYVTLVAAR